MSYYEKDPHRPWAYRRSEYHPGANHKYPFGRPAAQGSEFGVGSIIVFILLVPFIFAVNFMWAKKTLLLQALGVSAAIIVLIGVNILFDKESYLDTFWRKMRGPLIKICSYLSGIILFILWFGYMIN